MAGQKGKAILVKMDIASVFTSIGGMRSKSLRVSDGNSDASDSDSEFQEMLMGTGHKKLAISVSGIYKEAASEKAVLSNKLNRVAPDMQFIYPGLGTFEGAFVIGDIEYAGEHEGEATYTFAFDSHGEFTFTPA